MKIYVVTDGDYSDYHIVALCSTQENAEEVVVSNKSRWNDPNIEEWELDDFKKCPNGLLPWGVKMNREGASSLERETLASFSPRVVPYGDGENMVFDVFAKDEKHAVKIANEKRVQLVAMDNWDVNWDNWKADQEKFNKIIGSLK